MILIYSDGIYDFLFNLKSGFLKEYAELIKKEKNINAKNSKEHGWSVLHKGIFDRVSFHYINKLIKIPYKRKKLIELFHLYSFC